MLAGPLHNRVLAVLFAAKEPIPFSQLQEVFPDVAEQTLRQTIQDLVAQFNSLQQAVQIREVGGGYRLTTLPQHHEDIQLYLKTKPSAKLSLPALETLAVIAYKQPITLPEILEIRGVKSTSTIRTLLEKKLVETRGRKKVVGRPIMYGTTKEFAVHFGLKDLSELPTLEELEEVLSERAD